MDAVSINDFKSAVSRFATGLCVVTANTAPGPTGFTCQSFTSLSLDPLLVVFAAGSSGKTWSTMRDATTVGISVLGVDQQATAQLFATSGVDKFAQQEWRSGPGGAPLLTPALAHIEGDVHDISTFGDHDLVVVRVHYVASFDGDPLIYSQGTYARLG